MLSASLRTSSTVVKSPPQLLQNHPKKHENTDIDCACPSLSLSLFFLFSPLSLSLSLSLYLPLPPPLYLPLTIPLPLSFLSPPPPCRSLLPPPPPCLPPSLAQPLPAPAPRARGSTRIPFAGRVRQMMKYNSIYEGYLHSMHSLWLRGVCACLYIYIYTHKHYACWFAGFGFMSQPVGRLSAAQWAGFRDNGFTLYFIVSHGVRFGLRLANVISEMMFFADSAA